MFSKAVRDTSSFHDCCSVLPNITLDEKDGEREGQMFWSPPSFSPLSYVVFTFSFSSSDLHGLVLFFPLCSFSLCLKPLGFIRTERKRKIVREIGNHQEWAGLNLNVMTKSQWLLFFFHASHTCLNSLSTSLVVPECYLEMCTSHAVCNIDYAICVLTKSIKLNDLPLHPITHRTQPRIWPSPQQRHIALIYSPCLTQSCRLLSEGYT